MIKQHIHQLIPLTCPLSMNELIIKHERKLSIETINQALSMHGLIPTNTEQLVKGKN